MFIQLIITFLSFAVLIYIGYSLSKKDILKAQTNEDLTQLLIKVLMPFSIIHSGNSERGDLNLNGLLSAFFIIAAFYVMGSLLMYMFFRFVYRAGEEKGDFTNLTIYANTGFVGFPLASAILGPQSLIYVVVFNLCYNLFLYSLGIKLFGDGIKIGKMLFSPLMICSYFSILWFLSPYRFSPSIASTISAVGNSTMPVSMFIIGSWLLNSSLKEWMGNKRAYIVNIFRLIVLPLLMLAVMKVSGFPQIAILSVVLISALPVGTMNVIFAKQYHRDYVFISSALMQSMILSFITIPLIMMISYGTTTFL